ncbi:MAG: phosphatase PAP2 family protein [Acidobacteriia bacterium]|nr:phosphatase PAP2 family protein [Terriglobia bacterium]
MRAERSSAAWMAVLLSAMASCAWAGQQEVQPVSTAAKAPEFRDTRVGLSLLENMARDQREIWTSPARLRWRDTAWLVPLAGVTAGVISVEREAVQHITLSPQNVQRSRNVSNYGVGALVGVGGGLYLWGKLSHDDHRREAGLLSGEAFFNALAVTSAFQQITSRERPFANNAAGRLGQYGTNGNSFPSNHAAAAWSVASVLAHEYPGPLTKIFAYGLASAVSVTRVTGKEHFPSDVLIGSAIGYLMGRQVYRAHHNPELGGAPWGSPLDEHAEIFERKIARSGAVYVPLESWVYPAFERLAALHYITTDARGQRPWTRLECARLVEEAGEAMQEAEGHPPSHLTERMVEALRKEFAPELELPEGGHLGRSFAVDSLYTRVMSLSGPVLNDSMHFGQTIVNDYGRPFRRGTNVITGASFSGSYGNFFAYVRGEVQHAPGQPALSDAVRQLNAVQNWLPVQPGVVFPAINRFQLLDAYFGMSLGNWQVSFGRQSLWLGTDDSGPFLWSNNAAPVNLFRIDRPTPFRLPGLFRLLGPAKAEFAVGQLGGHTVAAHNWIQMQRVSLKTFRNFEFGATHTAQWGGDGQPNGIGPFFKVLLPFHELGRELAGKPSLSVQSLSFDFQYRFGKVATFYTELWARDMFTPFDNFGRLAPLGGLYFPRLPWLRNTDLRIESGYTDSPLNTAPLINEGFLHYFHSTYKNGYTNDGMILGNAMGRIAQMYQASAAHWFSPTSRLQVSFKRMQVSPTFVPGGAHWNDYGVRHEQQLKSGFWIKGFVQVEQLQYPALSLERANNVTASLELSYSPGRMGKR